VGTTGRAVLKLVEAFSKSGELVLDPLCGTGTTGIAALQLGRRFLGVDKDKRLCRLQSKGCQRAEPSSGFSRSW